MSDEQGVARYVPPSVHRAMRRIGRRLGQAIFWLCILGIPATYYASR